MTTTDKENKFIKKECPHVKGFTHSGSTEDKKSHIYICPDCHERHMVSIKSKTVDRRITS